MNLNPRGPFDFPVTDSELDAFYGYAPSEFNVQQAIGAASASVGMMELTDSMLRMDEELFLDAIAAKDAKKIGELVLLARRMRIAEIASKWVYDRIGVIKESDVQV